MTRLSLVRRPAPAILTALAVLLALVAAPLAPVRAQGGALLDVQRHAGPSRTATAAAVAAHTHAEGADHVVLARADAYGDALAAAPLAAALDAPVLLTGIDGLDPHTATEVARLDPDVITVIGDIGSAVVDQLDGRAIRRLRGADAWMTWATIALEVARLTGADHALLVEGHHTDPQRGWPDALSASSWAASAQVPVLLTTAGELPTATRDALSAMQPARVTVVGGTAAVSDGVADQAAAAAGASVDRVAGSDRYTTAVAIAQQGLGEGRQASSMWVASGRGWPDALVAGPAAARDGAVLVLSDPASMTHSPATLAFIDGQRGAATTAHLVGGTAVLSDAVATTIATGQIGDTPAPAPAPAPDPGTRAGDAERPPPVPARNTAPPIEDAVPWSDPATWGGRLPAAGEVVTIPADKAVLLDVDAPVLRGLQVDGTLVVADRDTTLETGWIVVEGHLAVGTPDRPLTSDVTIVLDPHAGDSISGAGEGPLAVQGGTLDIHGITPARTWTRLATTAVAGSTTVTLQEAPGWQVGDTVVLASTTTDPDQAEERTVTAISGTSVTLDRPLTHTHWGQTDQIAGAQVAMHGEVAALDRNVVITSSPEAIAAGRGGHVLVFNGSVARISGAELSGLGQAGQIARYPIHFHLMGNASGSWIRGASVHHTNNRCVTFHGSDYIDMTDTVGYESQGHCFFFEDGVETGNTLHCNLGLSTRRPADGLRTIESDDTPATFWITNPTNHLTGNVAAGSDSHGFWYDLPEAPTGLSADRELDIRRLPFGTFDDNVAHSSPDNGWKNGIGIFVEDYHPPTPAIMRGNDVWKSGSFGAWIEGTELHDSVLAGNTIGFLGLRAALVDATVVGSTSNAADSPWRQTGVGFYHQHSEITDVTFVNFGARQHSWQHPRYAMEFIAEVHNEVSDVSGVTFVNVENPLRVTQPTHPEDGPDDRSAAVRDVDGSVSGAPALLTSADPLLHEASCPWREDLGAHVCPADWDRTWLMMGDLGGVDLGLTSLTRADGATRVLDAPSWAPRQLAADVLLDRAYRMQPTVPTSGHMELIIAGGAEGHIDLSIPWPHADAFVYDGWGRWHPVERGTGPDALADGRYWFDGTTLHVRHTLDDIEEKGRWQRLELCAQAYCGNAGPG